MSVRPQRVSGSRTGRRKAPVISARRLALACLLFLLAVELGVVALRSPWFYVRTVRIEGVKTIPRARLVQGLHIPSRTNLFRLQKQMIEGAMKRNPVIESVTVHKMIPGTVRVRIVERKPHLILRAQGRFYEIDAVGVPFCTVVGPSKNLPIVLCQVKDRISLGEPLKAPSFYAARNCLLLAQQKKNLRVTKISVDQNRDLCLNTRDGFRVRLGQPHRLTEKLDIVERALDQMPDIRREAEYIDVTCPEAPSFKLREKS